MTRMVYCGDVAIGGGAPVSIQSMTNVDTRDTDKLVRHVPAESRDQGLLSCVIPAGSSA